ncbi:hypothetical protein SCAR479_00155 [Seiridium cardinale]|uniref:RING-type domain-containing protein n=1 Tax=Seiridium cardinale TaxID=138064 RepID=A0ABR2Y8P2_9PEZI
MHQPASAGFDDSHIQRRAWQRPNAIRSDEHASEGPVDHPWENIVIACFSAFSLLLLLAIFFRTRLSRLCNGVFKKRKKQRPSLPKSLQRAITELAEVTDYRGHRNEQRDCDERECPICLASLYSGPEELEAITGPHLDVEANTQLTSAKAQSTGSGNASSTVSGFSDKKKKAGPWQPQPIDDDVVKMKRCQHMFHGRCLASWFLRKRYDCPVCRRIYYQPVENSLSHREEVPYQSSMPIMPFF